MSSNFNTANNEGLTPPGTQGTPFSQTTQGILRMGETAFGTQEAQSPRITIPTSQQEETELRYNAQIDHTVTKLADILPAVGEGEEGYVGQAGNNVEMDSEDENDDSEINNEGILYFEYFPDNHYGADFVWDIAMTSLVNLSSLFGDRKFYKALMKSWKKDYDQREIDEYAEVYKGKMALLNERFLNLSASFPKFFRGNKNTTLPALLAPHGDGSCDR